MVHKFLCSIKEGILLAACCPFLTNGKLLHVEGTMIKKGTLIIFLCLLRSILCIPLSQFYPFGGDAEESNQKLEKGNSAISEEIITENLYYFYGQPEFTASVSYTVYPTDHGVYS